MREYLFSLNRSVGDMSIFRLSRVRKLGSVARHFVFGFRERLRDAAAAAGGAE